MFTNKDRSENKDGDKAKRSRLFRSLLHTMFRFFFSCHDKKANNVKTVYSVNKIYCKQQLYGNEHS